MQLLGQEVNVDDYVKHTVGLSREIKKVKGEMKKVGIEKVNVMHSQTIVESARVAVVVVWDVAIATKDKAIAQSESL